MDTSADTPCGPTPDVLSLLEAIPSSSVLMDLEGRITCWNRAAEELTGWSRDEALGHSLAELLAIPPDQRGCLERLASAADSSEEEPRRAQLSARRKDGGTLSVAVSVTAFELGGVRVLGGFVADLGKRRELEAQLLRAQKMEITGRLAASIAHDFNNLLIVVLGSSEVLLQQLPEGDRRRELVGEVLAAGRRGAVLARQLLSSNRHRLEEVRVIDSNALLTEVEPMLRRLLGREVRLVMSLRQGLDGVRADPAHIEQLVMNLIVNARDAIPESGTVWVETARLEVLATVPAHAEALQPGLYVAISVSDDGVGMDDATQRRIFDPYFTTKESRGGTGLGLATCRMIAERYGGRISVTSKPGRGSRFVVHLPAANDGLETAMSDDAARDSMRGTETVLLVEDDDTVRTMLRQALTVHGYTVVDTSSAAAALDYARRVPAAAELVLTDLILPGMNGRELCDQLRTIDPNIRCLLMSGYGADVWSRHGADEYPLVQKPFAIDALLQRIRAALGKIPL